MPTTVDDLYKQAAISGEWNFALWTTFLIDEEGEAVIPKDEFQRNDLAYKVGALAPHVKGCPEEEAFCEKLLVNVMSYDEQNSGHSLSLSREDFEWLLTKLEEQPSANPRLRRLLAIQAPWEC